MFDGGGFRPASGLIFKISAGAVAASGINIAVAKKCDITMFLADLSDEPFPSGIVFIGTDNGGLHCLGVSGIVCNIEPNDIFGSFRR